jgi:predicted GIY-YIG superfamily endonuclease
MSTNIYILRLQGGRFYVGKSADTARRYQEHLAGTASAWTRKYKPVALERVITNASSFDEDKYTKELMAKHGIEKVRGGAYVTEVLEDFQEEALRREIWGAGNKCTLCGRAGHFVKDCYARTDVEGNEIVSDAESETSSRSSSSVEVSSKYYNPFYALQQKGAIKKEIKKKESPPVQVVRKEIKKKESPPTQVVQKMVSKTACYRCGRAGHFASDCYANRHVKGYYINSDSE